MTKSKTAPTNTTVGALKNALKRVTAATNAKSATMAVDSEGLRVEAATTEGYASVRVSIQGIPGEVCEAAIGASLVNIILTGEDADTTLTVAGDEKGARLRYAGANLLLKKPETSIDEMFAQSYRAMGSTPIITLTGEQLRAAALGSASFMARRDVRHYLCGVHMVERGGKLTFEGTDGFSMHQHNTEHLVAAEAKDLDVIIPVHSAQAMVSVFGADEAVTIEKVGTQLIGFRTEDAYWVSNMIAAKFPDCTKFFDVETIAKKTGVMMVLPRKAFVSALNRVSSVAQREGNFVRLIFEGKGVRVTSTDGDQQDVLSALHVNGASGSHECIVTSAVAINAFSGVHGDHVLIVKGPDCMDKLFFRPAHLDGDQWQFEKGWQALLMPARF